MKEPAASMSPIIFPQYRRYKNGRSYFMISDTESFEEVRSFGDRWLIAQHRARILPDRNFIYDLLHDFHTFAEAITMEQYLGIREMAVHE